MNRRKRPHPSHILRLEDVRPGEIIIIEFYRIKGRFGEVKVITNSPETRQLLVEIHWRNFKETGSVEFERFVINYNDDEVKNFHVLNKMRRGPASGERLPKNQ